MKNKKIISIILALVIMLNSLWVSVSADAVQFTELSNESGTWNNIATNGSGLKVAVASVWHWSGTDQGKIMTSADGVTWTTQVSGHANALYSVVWGNSKFVTVGAGGTILTSADGVTWTSRTSGISNTLNSITWSGSKFVAVGPSGTILTSPDGVIWTKINGITDTLMYITYGSSKFVAVGVGGTILTSTDGNSWASQNSGTTSMLNFVIWNGSQFVAVGTGGTILTSADGNSWISQNSNINNDLKSIAWDGSKFIAVSSSETIVITSTNGTAWSSPLYPKTTIATIRAIKYLDNKLNILGNNIITNVTFLIPKSIIQTDIDELDELATANVSTAFVYDQNSNLMEGGYTLTYSIADTNVATVNENGLITAKEYVEGANTTTLTISTVENPSLQKIINITVLDGGSIPLTGEGISDDELKQLLNNVDFKIEVIKNSSGTANINSNLEVMKKMLEVQDNSSKNKLLKGLNDFMDAITGNIIIINGTANRILNH